MKFAETLLSRGPGVRLVVLALALPGASACGGGGAGSAATPSAATAAAAVAFGAPGPNVQPISVNPGPAGDYANGAFTSVIVCVPGTSTCQTIGGVLVDTGSSGLRLLASAVNLQFAPVLDPGGSPIAECNQFQDSYEWGSIVRADIRLAEETASSVPIQLIGDPAFPTVPSDCSNSGLPSQDTVALLGANGVLGVGLWHEDCGPACAQAGSKNPGLYYACPAGGCQAAAVSLDRQAQNPVWRFASDNNGVALALPSIPDAGAPTVSGSMVFGIGTRANNSLGSAGVYPVDGFGNITTTFRNLSYPSSFIDSGSNGFFFLDSATVSIPACRSATDFYCPPTPLSLQAANRGQTGGGATFSFNVASADVLFNSPNFAFNNLGGPNSGSFDWGLPFFFGRIVFTAIEQQSTPAGAGPYFAY
jgi:hypothetical protein